MLTTLLTLPKYWQAIILVCFSACIGSFLNVVVYRLAVKLGLVDWDDSKPLPSITWSRSFCPECKTQLAWHDNIPLIGFLLLRGRCRHCQQKISYQYPVVELASIIISLTLFFCIGVNLKLLAGLLLCWWLLPMLVLDLKYFILPDQLTLSLIFISLVINYFNIFTSFKSALIGAAVGYLSLAILDTLYYWLRKRHGIGQGDWKLLAALGAFFGWQILFNVLTISAVIGTLVGITLILAKKGHMQSELPFGVFLALGAFIQLLLSSIA